MNGWTDADEFECLVDAARREQNVGLQNALTGYRGHLHTAARAATAGRRWPVRPADISGTPDRPKWQKPHYNRQFRHWPRPSR
ncbi:hypothetical protein CIW52_17700 [Mycolicibacterium sp. P9-64]|nr:hypothetical protein CIW52_17700 [Mycolicibacterium sp. P9-64]